MKKTNFLPEKLSDFHFIWIIIVTSLSYGCASNGIQTSIGEEVTDVMPVFERGDARLNCNTSCSGAWGSSRNKFKDLYEHGLWKDLVIEVAKVGFKSDQTYFYLGRAAEGLGYTESARTYYKLGLVSFKCNGLFNNCDGLVFPREINDAINRLPAPPKVESPIATSRTPTPTSAEFSENKIKPEELVSAEAVIHSPKQETSSEYKNTTSITSVEEKSPKTKRGATIVSEPVTQTENDDSKKSKSHLTTQNEYDEQSLNDDLGVITFKDVPLDKPWVKADILNICKEDDSNSTYGSSCNFTDGRLLMWVSYGISRDLANVTLGKDESLLSVNIMSSKPIILAQVEVLTKKYGKPSKTIEQVTNGFGMKFDKEIYTWTDIRGSRITAESMYAKVDQGRIIIESPSSVISKKVFEKLIIDAGKDNL